MPVLNLENVSFSYGSHQVIDRVTIHFGDGERAFLIGPNGSGKTTLLSLMMGNLVPEAGTIRSTGTQQDIPDPNRFEGTISEYLDEALRPLNELLARFEKLSESIVEDGTDDWEAEYDQLLTVLNVRDVWSLEARTEQVMAGLGLPENTKTVDGRRLDSLSPGQRMRLKLAALLILRPETLILDEPTNHLDVAAVRFLIDTLTAWHGPVVVASHDRDFIERTATVIYDLDLIVWRELAKADGREIAGVYRNSGNYSAYLEAKTVAEAQHAKIHAEQQVRKRELHEHRDESIKIARGGVKMKTAVGMSKKFFSDRAAATSVRRTRNDDVRLERLAEQEVQKPRHYHLKFPTPADAQVTNSVTVSARQARVPGRLQSVNFDLANGEHLLITGVNGSGKTTLLTWIATGIPPVDWNSCGSIVCDQRLAVVPQLLPRCGDPGFTTEIWSNGVGEIGKGILHPSKWNTPVSELSAGNQRRAQLAVALATNPRVLVVDEPTNYLDLETMQALEDALRDFPGTLIVASHDQWLIDHWQGRRMNLESAAEKN